MRIIKVLVFCCVVSLALVGASIGTLAQTDVGPSPNPDCADDPILRGTCLDDTRDAGGGSGVGGLGGPGSTGAASGANPSVPGLDAGAEFGDAVISGVDNTVDGAVDAGEAAHDEVSADDPGEITVEGDDGDFTFDTTACDGDYMPTKSTSECDTPTPDART